MLSVEKLTKRFGGERAIDAVGGIGFSVDAGEFVAIVGKSGSGKSTLLAMLGGLSKPTAGKILVDGVNQWQLSEEEHADFRNRKVGFVFQFASLLPSLRAIDNVALPALISGTLTRDEAYRRARQLLEQVGLGKRYDFFPAELSGGEQRRVAIARALINSPTVLLADEPTADLDEETEEEILNVLIGMHHAYNLTLVVVTHNMDIAARANRVMRMRAGQIISNEAQGDVQHATSTEKPRSSDNDVADQVATIKRIFEQSGTATTEKITLGAGAEQFLGRVVLFSLPLFAMIWAFNYAVAYFESQMIAQQVAAQQALEDLTMGVLRAEVKDVTMGPGKSYNVSLYLRNTTGTQPLYVLSPTVRGFVQVGNSWNEVTLKPAASTATGQVDKITGEKLYHYTMHPDIADYAQLLPYYMHVRISNEMLVSASSQPKNDLMERSDNYYIYLKPHGISDEAILKKLKFPGKAPVWIPMPPH